MHPLAPAQRLVLSTPLAAYVAATTTTTARTTTTRTAVVAMTLCGRR